MTDDNTHRISSSNEEIIIEEKYTPEEKELIAALAIRSYHLPGYSYMGDLWQYISNNHPFLGIFLHHKLHPVHTGWRLLIFLGSILFGLTVSNIFFLLVLSDDRYQQEVFVVTTIGGEEWTITYAYIMLWTLGGSAHALFDMSIWYITSCGGCCPFSDRCQVFGHVLVVFTIAFLLAMASFMVVLRASIQHQEDDGEKVNIYDLDSGGLANDQIELYEIEKEDVNFLLGYLMEFAVAMVIYYPLGSIILFSGVLGCFRLPILGGRPRDIYVLSKERAKKALGLDDGF